MILNVKNANECIKKLIDEIKKELDFSLINENVDVTLERSDKFVISYDDGEFKIQYSKEKNVFFALSYIMSLILKDDISNGFKKEFKRTIENLTFMIDCSRNSVLKVETVKKLIRTLSLMGYDSLMLYTEDTFEVKEYPYFGYLRNPYTENEIKEIDEYAKSFGIELIPCIQTLAHFNTLIRHIAMKDLFDCNDIVLVGSDYTYQFIESLIKTCRKYFSSKKIHIGMDEASMTGRGRYLNENGYKPRFELMCEHLSKVVEICKKYDFEPMMWSDMFVNVAMDTENIERNKKLVSKEVELVYWDYYSMDYNHYLENINIHKNLDNKIGFAGACWKWLGFTPDNRFSFVSIEKSMKAVNDAEIKNYIVTAWGDNGSECSLFGVLPSMLYASRAAYSEYDLDDSFKNQFEVISNIPFLNFMTIDLLNRTTRNDDPYERSSSNKYLLYNDPLMGTLDTTITKNVTEIYNEHLMKLKYAYSRSGKWSYIFKTQFELAKVLSIKAEFGVKLRNAYQNGNINTLKEMIKEIDVLLEYIDSFKRTFRVQWNTENKPNGIDVFDLRIGALIERLNITKEKLDDYLNGRIDSIPELEEKLLDFLGNGDRFKEDYNQCEYRWRYMTSVNVND